ncbi:hypothetical protein V6N12_054244 [Hibiscus sabdariffa]|uniref:Uncharacterized protein n=1 Tax=Hibiscus sabdariffa TaxID=183260 RepID=A0ABR2CZU5_9ROSI
MRCELKQMRVTDRKSKAKLRKLEQINAETREANRQASIDNARNQLYIQAMLRLLHGLMVKVKPNLSIISTVYAQTTRFSNLGDFPFLSFHHHVLRYFFFLSESDGGEKITNQNLSFKNSLRRQSEKLSVFLSSAVFGTDFGQGSRDSADRSSAQPGPSRSVQPLHPVAPTLTGPRIFLDKPPEDQHWRIGTSCIVPLFISAKMSTRRGRRPVRARGRPARYADPIDVPIPDPPPPVDPPAPEVPPVPRAKKYQGAVSMLDGPFQEQIYWREIPETNEAGISESEAGF